MERWILNEKIDKVLFRLAVPAVITNFSELLLNLGDTFWVSFLGDTSVAALGTASYIIWIIFSLLDIVESSTISLVSHEVGAGKVSSANKIFTRLLSFFMIFFVSLIIPGILLSKIGLEATGVEEAVFEGAFTYVFVTFLFLPVMLLFYALEAATQAFGDTRSPMEATFIVVILNLLIDPVLVLHFKMGLAGLAIASGISRIAGIFYIYRKFVKTAGFSSKSHKFPDFDFRLGVRAFSIGFPVSLGGISFSLIYFYIVKIVARFGTPAVAAMAVGNRIEGITYLFGVGYYTAVAAVVGQSIGAQKPERAKRALNRALIHSGLFGLIMGILFFFFPDIFGRPFLHEHQSLSIFKSYLRINAFNQIAMIYHVVLEGAFVGVGYTLPNFVVPIPFWFLRIPLSIYLAFKAGIGVNGVWLSMLITQTISSALLYVWWRILVNHHKALRQVKSPGAHL